LARHSRTKALSAGGIDISVRALGGVGDSRVEKAFLLDHRHVPCARSRRANRRRGPVMRRPGARPHLERSSGADCHPWPCGASPVSASWSRTSRKAHRAAGRASARSPRRPLESRESGSPAKLRAMGDQHAAGEPMPPAGGRRRSCGKQGWTRLRGGRAAPGPRPR
jgi:hypothetical protein